MILQKGTLEHGDKVALKKGYPPCRCSRSVLKGCRRQLWGGPNDSRSSPENDSQNSLNAEAGSDIEINQVKMAGQNLTDFISSTPKSPDCDR